MKDYKFWLCISIALFFILTNSFFYQKHAERILGILDLQVKYDKLDSRIINLKEAILMEKKVKEIIANELDIKLDRITKESTLKSLGVNSLDKVNLVLALEEELAIEIPDEDESRLDTVNDLILYCEAKVLSRQQ